MKRLSPLLTLLLLAAPLRAQEGVEDAETEEPMINVKVMVPPGVEEEESVAPAITPKKVVPTATIMRTRKQAKKIVAPAKSAPRKDAKAAVVVKAKTVAKPSPPVSAVPLTPITPRNP